MIIVGYIRDFETETAKKTNIFLLPEHANFLFSLFVFLFNMLFTVQLLIDYLIDIND